MQPMVFFNLHLALSFSAFGSLAFFSKQCSALEDFQQLPA
jgi:hypothetical protein